MEAGNGIQSVALQGLGYKVLAVDFNQQLLKELKSNPKSKGINTELREIRNVSELDSLRPELITCCGAIITQLESQNNGFII